jgi:hypothetical protein
MGQVLGWVGMGPSLSVDLLSCLTHFESGGDEAKCTL